MTLKTIKISEENYRWLLQLAGELQKNYGRSISVDKALSELKEKKRRIIKIS